MKHPPTIERIDVVPVRLPLIEPFAIAYATYTHTSSVLLRVTLASGETGWGEATPDPDVTGETWESVIANLRSVAPWLLGFDARRIDAARTRMEATLGGAPAAMAAIDIALHDVVARIAGMPVWALLGGREAGALTISRVVSIDTPEAMATAAEEHVSSGFRTIKLKVGESHDPALDARRILAVRAAVGSAVGLKVDVNQGWQSAELAIEAIRAAHGAKVDYYEQPVNKHDLEGLARVRRVTGAPIMVDEGCLGASDALRVAQLEAADFINIKLMKCGGLRNGVAVDAIARAAGMRTQVGTMVESSIASAAGLHLAAALSNVVTVEMGGPLMHAVDVGDAKSWYRHDRIQVPDTPGLGITVDDGLVSRIATEWHTIG
ncbi:MAG: mandelate racemase/muconate lactonizing enzyme family protein [Thermomicrobiales bacterium]